VHNEATYDSLRGKQYPYAIIDSIKGDSVFVHMVTKKEFIYKR